MAFNPPIPEEHRDAVLRAYVPRKFTAAMVVAAAAAGELTDASGRPVAAFEISPNTVRDLARRHRPSRQSTMVDSGEVVVSPGDEIGQALQDLLAAMRAETKAARAAQRAGAPATRRLLDGARLAREVLALEKQFAGRQAPRPPVPRDPAPMSAMAGGRTAGPLLEAHRADRSSGDWQCRCVPAPDAVPEVAPEPDPHEALVDQLRVDLERVRERQERAHDAARQALRGEDPEPDADLDADGGSQRGQRRRWHDHEPAVGR